jgi:lysozyme
MTDKLIEQLKFEEGLRLDAYHCTEGRRTIGYGHNLDAKPYYKGCRIASSITESLAEELLEYDVETTIEQLDAAWHGFQLLTRARQDACINMAFQLGVEGFMKFQKLRDALVHCDFVKAKDEALRSQWAKQTPARALRVANQLLTGEYYAV